MGLDIPSFSLIFDTGRGTYMKVDFLPSLLVQNGSRISLCNVDFGFPLYLSLSPHLLGLPYEELQALWLENLGGRGWLGRLI